MKFEVRTASDKELKNKERPPVAGSYADGETTRWWGNATRWSIDIQTLEDLLEVLKENGRLILEENLITIYDDYVE